MGVVRARLCPAVRRVFQQQRRHVAGNFYFPVVRTFVMGLFKRAEQAVDATRDGINTSLVVASIAVVLAAIALMIAVSRNA